MSQWVWACGDFGDMPRGACSDRGWRAVECEGHRPGGDEMSVNGLHQAPASSRVRERGPGAVAATSWRHHQAPDTIEMDPLAVEDFGWRQSFKVPRSNVRNESLDLSTGGPI